MARTVIDVHSVTSGGGWRFRATGDPVVVFVLVTYVDGQYPNLGPNKCVLALNDLDYGDDLIGLEIDRLANVPIEKAEQ